MKNDIYLLKAADKVRYKGTGPFWFPDMASNANQRLEIGKVYTVGSKQIFSSWVMITLKETEDSEYSLEWFNIENL